MNRKILIFGAVLIALIIAIMFLRRGDARERSYPIFGTDSLSISRIQVIDPTDSLTIIQTDEGWKLTYPVEWGVSQEHLEAFFAQVMRATSSKTQMSTSEDAIQRYGLVPGTALQIKVWDKNNKLKDHVYFNNFGSSWDYFRYDGSTEVYQVRNLISKTYMADLQQWRSKELMRIFETALNSIEVSYPQNSYTLTFKDGRWFYKDRNENFEIHAENRPHLRLLNILNNLDTWVFYDDNTEEYQEAFQDPMATVILHLTDGSTRKLTFAEPKTNEFMLMLDDKATPLYGVVKDTILRFTIDSRYFKQLPYGSTPPHPVEE